MYQKKKIRLNTTRFFTIKISNKRELKQMAYNLLSDFDSKNFMSFYKNLH